MLESLRLGDTTGLSRQELAERVEALRLPWVLALVAKMAVPLIGLAIWLLPAACAAVVVTETLERSTGALARAFGLGLAVPVFGASFIAVAGLFSLIGQPGIVAGKFPRRADHPVYALRRIYGLCWTQLYYFRPLYALCLAMPPLKWLVFRLFGYRGTMQFTIYPDTWIRDLPMLSFSPGAYVGNRACVGTNICLNDGTIIVGPVTCRLNSMVGHLAVFGLGTDLGEGAEIGVGAATGFAVRIGARASIKPRANVNNGALIGEGAIVGTAALIGQKATIGPGIEIPAGASIPAFAVIATQADADRYCIHKTQGLLERDAV
jgi:carbonic anhydrase/acetyltransferase-like protein (isoleucine patch superfamily)